MIGLIWRFLVALFDWRTFIRRIKQLPTIDAVFISNMRDETDKRIFFGKKKLKGDHSNMHRLWLHNNISGRIRVIHSLSEDLFSISGRKKYKNQIGSVIKWAENINSRVVLLSASTKRVFGNGNELKEKFPNMLFTIGDNGTVLLLKNETLDILKISGLNNNAKILVVGPYGFLGEAMVRILLNNKYAVIGVGANIAGLNRISQEYNIPVFEHYNRVGKIDAVIACTHSEKVKLNVKNIELINHQNKKLIVVDVSEPSNLSKEEYLKCKNQVIRIDAGNAYSKNLKYVLGCLSYKMLRLQKGITFGCFAEALVLAAELNNKSSQFNIMDKNWFEVNEENMEIIENLFQKYSITYPSFRCFGKVLHL